MDGHRFDELTRSLATGASRRRALRLLAGGAAAGFLSLLLGAGVRADDDGDDDDGGGCKRTGKRCRKHGQCCSGTCLADGICGCAADADCDDGNACTTDFCDTGSGECISLFEVECAPCRRNQDCPVGVCLPEGRCGCATNADCDDGNACTIDTCTAEFDELNVETGRRRCVHTPIEGCTQCRRDADCGGGVCCHGRCCPAGGCGVSVTGDALCCPDCRDGRCCDDLRRADDGSEIIFSPAQCFGSQDQICSIGSCQVVEDANGVITAIDCVLPIFRPA